MLIQIRGRKIIVTSPEWSMDCFRAPGKHSSSSGRRDNLGDDRIGSSAGLKIPNDTTIHYRGLEKGD